VSLAQTQGALERAEADNLTVRQHLDLIGFALAMNSVALHEHRRRRDTAMAA
jgi:hypothetical protein